MPSERKEERIIASPLTPMISKIVVSANHLCVADYETVDLRNRPFKVKRHELLDVLLKESSGMSLYGGPSPPYLTLEVWIQKIWAESSVNFYLQVFFIM